MAFTFTPKSDEEINAARNAALNAALMPDGIYKFKVKDALEEVSKKGNPQIKVTLGVTDLDGDERTITDYLLGSEQMIYKLKSFCEAIGMLAEYEKGSLEPSKMWDKVGHANINTSKGQAKPDGSGYYNDKNSVKSYIKANSPEKSEKSDEFKDSDITF